MSSLQLFRAGQADVYAPNRSSKAYHKLSERLHFQRRTCIAKLGFDSDLSICGMNTFTFHSDYLQAAG